MTPQRAIAWTVQAGLIEAAARISQAEQSELQRVDTVFHARLDRQYGPDEERWPGGVRYAYQTSVAAIHNQHHRRAA